MNELTTKGYEIEEGAMFAALSAHAAERPDVIVIGGGQAGLSVGYHLKQQGVRFLILDAAERVGDAWRKRWDSLRLFTPAWLDSLDGLPFPADRNHFPTKDEMADYLEAYARHFALPVHGGVRVTRLTRDSRGYRIETNRGEYRAPQVVVAMSSYQRRKLPTWASELAPEIVQLHGSEYRSSAQLRPGAVLMVGAGNTGAEIGIELARQGRAVFLSGRDTGHVPFKMDGFWARVLLCRLVLRGVFHYLLTIRTPLGRKARPKMISQGGPLIRQKPAELARAGVERAPRTVGVENGLPKLGDGRVLSVTNVIFSTGFESGLDFIELPIFDEGGEPRHDAGVVKEAPGLYFVGQHFLYSYSSTMIHGVGRDAGRIAALISVSAAPHRERESAQGPGPLPENVGISAGSPV